jgi:hypothetical protein
MEKCNEPTENNIRGTAAGDAGEGEAEAPNRKALAGKVAGTNLGDPSLLGADDEG